MAKSKRVVQATNKKNRGNNIKRGKWLRELHSFLKQINGH